LGCYLCAGQTPTHTWCWVMPQCWAHPCTTWRLGCLPRLGTPQHTRGAWASLVVAHAVPHFRTPSAWVMTLDPRKMGLASRPTINRSSVRTQFYWVLHQEPRFRGSRILHIIFCFRNIIIFIIIIILNKIINKFHIKYYY